MRTDSTDSTDSTDFFGREEVIVGAINEISETEHHPQRHIISFIVPVKERDRHSVLSVQLPDKGAGRKLIPIILKNPEGMTEYSLQWSEAELQVTLASA